MVELSRWTSCWRPFSSCSKEVGDLYFFFKNSPCQTGLIFLKKKIVSVCGKKSVFHYVWLAAICFFSCCSTLLCDLGWFGRPLRPNPLLFSVASSTLFLPGTGIHPKKHQKNRGIFGKSTFEGRYSGYISVHFLKVVESRSRILLLPVRPPPSVNHSRHTVSPPLPLRIVTE